jgi:hypothetical protein
LNPGSRMAESEAVQHDSTKCHMTRSHFSHATFFATLVRCQRGTSELQLHANLCAIPRCMTHHDSRPDSTMTMHRLTTRTQRMRIVTILYSHPTSGRCPKAALVEVKPIAREPSCKPILSCAIPRQRQEREQVQLRTNGSSSWQQSSAAVLSYT